MISRLQIGQFTPICSMWAAFRNILERGIRRMFFVSLSLAPHVGGPGFRLDPAKNEETLRPKLQEIFNH